MEASSSAPNDDVAARAIPKDYRQVFQGKTPSKMVDPCQDARKASMKCLDRNAYDKDLCGDYFEMYKECKKRWFEQMREDRRNGLR